MDDLDLISNVSFYANVKKTKRFRNARDPNAELWAPPDPRHLNAAARRSAPVQPASADSIPRHQCRKIFEKGYRRQNRRYNAKRPALCAGGRNEWWEAVGIEAMLAVLHFVHEREHLRGDELHLDQDTIEY